VKPKGHSVAFFKVLNSPGGRITVLIFVLLIGLVADIIGVKYAKEMVIGTLTTILTLISRGRS
jgi:hypothetical protein